MNKDSKIEQILSALPDSPGIYMMLDAKKEIIYIGKANSLKKRVSSYFRKTAHDAKTAVLVKNISDIEFIATDSEIEALLLENNLIKKHKPKYNIRLKDDKRYPYIAVTLNEEYPRIIYTRNINKKTDRFFGPYTDARAAKNTAALINKTLKLKTCRRPLPLKKGERPCLNFQINRCSGACTGDITKEEYRALIDDAINLLEGNIDPVIKSLNRRMKQASSEMDFEKAARLRDVIFDIQKIAETQKVEIPSGINQDYFATGIFGDEALLVIFEFRNGILTGRKINIFDNAKYSEPEDIIRTFIVDYYNNREIPPRIVSEIRLSDLNIISSHLSIKASKKISITAASSQSDKAIIRLIKKNIDMLAAERSFSRENDANPGTAALQKALNLDSEPLIIECFDISNFHGQDAVASMVMFRNGKPDKKNYRRYKIKSYDTPNDPGMIHEAVSRRIQYLVNEEQELPDLMVIDGGRTQLSRAIEAAANFNTGINIISIAEKLDEIYTSPDEKSLRFPEGSAHLRLIQNIRDEAHRFAVTYHRKLRDKKTTASELDLIPDIGTKHKSSLLKHFKSLEKIKNATVTELMEAEGIGEKTALKIYSYFQKNLKKVI